MSKPIVEFTKIAQSGRCADGRFIKPEWLREAAANYSQEVYTALLWPEHLRWGNNWGEVVELEAREEEGGQVGLYARFVPNASYSWEKQYDQKLFYSMELNFEIMEDGTAYLEGLGVTDSPASLGMRPHRFSRREDDPSGTALSFSSGMPVVQFEQPDIPPGWFKAWSARFDKIFTKLSNFNEVTMTPEETQALIEAFKAEIEARLAALDARLSALEPKVEAAEAKAEEAEQAAEEAREKAGEAAGFSERLDEMATRFAQAAPGTATPENTGEGFKPLF